MRFTATSTSPEETEAWGRTWASLLRPGDVLRLEGGLGAGKTTFVRALATPRGVDPGLVSSPTYVIANEYPTAHGRIVHIDAYRLGEDDELESIGLDDLDDAVTIVEWPERIADRLPTPSALITIELLSETERSFDVTLPDAWRTRRGVEDLAPDVVRCPRTDIAVAPSDPWYPFADERSRLSDLHGWMSGAYRVERPLGPEDDALA